VPLLLNVGFNIRESLVILVHPCGPDAGAHRHSPLAIYPLNVFFHDFQCHSAGVPVDEAFAHHLCD
jgi:hypothetical protein